MHCRGEQVNGVREWVSPRNDKGLMQMGVIREYSTYWKDSFCMKFEVCFEVRQTHCLFKILDSASIQKYTSKTWIHFFIISK